MVTKAVGLRNDPARVEPQRVIDWVEHHVEDRAEAVFLAGNGFRAAGAVGGAGAADRSTRPLHQTPEMVRVLVVEMRRQHPRWGAKRIRMELLKHRRRGRRCRRRPRSSGS
jgi:hypothetical protein